MAHVIVEQAFTEPLTDERYAVFSKKLDPCIEVRHGMWRRSALALDKKRLICEFEAPDAESVREAFRMAGLPYERIYAVEVYAVEDYPEMKKRLDALLARKAV